jgi:hypothetical protein
MDRDHDETVTFFTAEAPRTQRRVFKIELLPPRALRLGGEIFFTH